MPQDSAQNALWVWDEDGEADDGAFWDEPDSRPSIQLESPENGAALFNSDFLDNSGWENQLGSGPAPAPHRGELISPYIDCSAYSSVFLSFY